LEVDGEDQIPVNANHKDMCKFDSRNDAVYEKLFKRIRRMLKDLVTRDDQGGTALHRAAHEGDVVELRKLLKENGADVKAKDN
jgi:ankyrin repeat protein